MKRAFAVIDSNYGDSGKGIMTDYLANAHTNENPIVVRFNGGSQAGHTVERNGIRHVFSHFGSGTLLGVPTYLSKNFIVNFPAFREEYEQLLSYGLDPKVYIHPECFSTLWQDICINQFIEEFRGNSRHGSCGFGINETVNRCLYENGYARTTTNKTNLTKNELESYYEVVFFKLKDELGLKLTDKQKEIFYDKNISEKWNKDRDFFWNHTKMINDNVLNLFDTVIFEGAQGLLLDQNHKNFPYVTRSNTGLQNVSEIMKNFLNIPLEAVYVTRCYLTRHGADPNFIETPIDDYIKVIDLTNKPNNWQGTLKFAPLDVEQLYTSILSDFNRFKLPNFTKSMAITCLDQIISDRLFRAKNKTYMPSHLGINTTEEFLHQIRFVNDNLNFEKLYKVFDHSKIEELKTKGFLNVQ